MDFDPSIRSLQGHAACQLTAIASLAHLCLQEQDSLPEAEKSLSFTFCNISLAQGSFKKFFGCLHETILVRNCFMMIYHTCYGYAYLLLQLTLLQASSS